MGDEEKNATVAPGAVALPSWLTGTWEATTEHEVHIFNPVLNGPHDKVKLYDFTFLGQRFQAESYRALQGSATGSVVQTYQGAGVCKEFRDKLFDAQHAIYRAYALHEKSRGRTPSEDGFRAWCMTPVVATLNTKPKFVASRLGWQFRKGNHSKGAAIDVDATYNPWVAMQSPPEKPAGGKLNEKSSTVYGGELHGLAVTDTVLKQSKIRAVEAYYNAVQFRHGSLNLDMRACKPGSGETSSQTYDRVVRVSNAITSYFYFFFDGYSALTIPSSVQESQLSRDATRGRMEYYRDNLPSTQEHKPLIDSLKKLLGDPDEFDRVRAQAKDDHENLRLAMVSGKAEKSGSRLTYGSSRDPCRGILSMRKEIVVNIRDQALRWGAVDFGEEQSGDIMHFDLGQDARVALSGMDPNPAGLFFTK